MAFLVVEEMAPCDCVPLDHRRLRGWVGAPDMHPARGRYHRRRRLVLDQGQLVGLGSHVTLPRERSSYATLWSDYARLLEGELAPGRPLRQA